MRNRRTKKPESYHPGISKLTGSKVREYLLSPNGVSAYGRRKVKPGKLEPFQAILNERQGYALKVLQKGKGG